MPTVWFHIPCRPSTNPTIGIRIDGQPTLEQKQGFVGGYIEAIHLPLAGVKTLYVHEEATLMAPPLVSNVIAGILAQQPIIGDALVELPNGTTLKDLLEEHIPDCFQWAD